VVNGHNLCPVTSDCNSGNSVYSRSPEIPEFFKQKFRNFGTSIFYIIGLRALSCLFCAIENRDSTRAYSMILLRPIRNAVRKAVIDLKLQSSIALSYEEIEQICTVVQVLQVVKLTVEVSCRRDATYF